MRGTVAYRRERLERLERRELRELRDEYTMVLGRLLHWHRRVCQDPASGGDGRSSPSLNVGVWARLAFCAGLRDVAPGRVSLVSGLLLRSS